MQKQALLILAKEPRPGKAKTRMTPPLTPDQAAALSSAFIADTLAAASQAKGTDIHLFYTPRESYSFFRELAPEGIALIPQQGTDLRERCAHSVSFAFEKGYDRIVQIGTDTPQIRAVHIRKAFAVLKDYDMTLGPANDGGYYLLALRRPAPSLYDGVEMGTERVLPKMLDNARNMGLSIRFMPEWIDADTFEDLLDLQRDPQQIPGRSTRGFLAALDRKGPPPRR
ncbi:MAG: glycosyltransferase [Deltaproteobacteria bacterium]|nr:glycosyltransferase [Deltaproteobacteria bacterium]